MYASYQEFLRSREWRIKRQLVMRRACNLCEVCFRDRAVEVHHLTYAHPWGDEPLTALKAVCRACHEWKHRAVA